MMYILALDMSLNCSGYSVLEYNEDTHVLEIIEKGTINNKKIPSSLLGKKLFNIEDCLTNLCNHYLFSCIVKEASFTTKRVMSSQRIHQVNGVLYLTMYKNGYNDIKEYSATTVKKHIAGSGKSEKQEVKDNLKYFVGVQDYKTNDESDAVAVGITHLLQNGYGIKLRECDS